MADYNQQFQANMARTGGVPAQLQMGSDKIQMMQFVQEQARMKAVADAQAVNDANMMAFRRDQLAQNQGQFDAGQVMDRDRMGVQASQFGQDFGIREQAGMRAEEIFNIEQDDRARAAAGEAAMGKMYGEMDETEMSDFMKSPRARAILGSEDIDDRTRSMLMDEARDAYVQLNRGSGSGIGGGTKDYAARQLMEEDKTLSYADAYAQASSYKMAPGAANILGGIAGEQETRKVLARADTAVDVAASKARLELGGIIDSSNRQLDLIDQILADTEGLESSYGGFLGAKGRQAAALPLSEAQRRIAPMIEQVTGAAFLEAFQQLKGGGHITEIEGLKATQAITRVTNQAQEPKDAIVAYQELQDIIRKGRIRAEMKAEGIVINPLDSQTYDGLIATLAEYRGQSAEGGSVDTDPYAEFR